MFHLSSAVSRSHKLEEDDILRTKFALKDIGYYDEPEYGMTPYSDERMFDSIKKFQKDKGLEVDGVMYPQGETAATIGKMIAEPWRPKPQVPGTPNTDPIDPGKTPPVNWPGNSTSRLMPRQGRRIDPQIQPMSYDPNEDPLQTDPCGQKKADMEYAKKEFLRTKNPSDRAEWLELANEYSRCINRPDPKAPKKRYPREFPTPPRPGR
jgi:hypothetical protein